MQSVVVFIYAAEYGRDNDILHGFAVGGYAVAERFCVIGSVAVRFTAYRTAAAHNKNGKQCNEKSGRDNKQADNFSEILQLILKRVKDCIKISAFC